MGNLPSKVFRMMAVRAPYSLKMTDGQTATRQGAPRNFSFVLSHGLTQTAMADAGQKMIGAGQLERQ